jgi:DNA (cytosine-5)-methyltransferase 1
MDFKDMIESGTFAWPAAMGEAQHWWEPPRVATGVPNRADRVKALGNAVSPQQVFPILQAIYAIETAQ